MQENATLASAKLVTVEVVLFPQHAKPWDASPWPELRRDKEGWPAPAISRLARLGIDDRAATVCITFGPARPAQQAPHHLGARRPGTPAG